MFALDKLYHMTQNLNTVTRLRYEPFSVWFKPFEFLQCEIRK